MYSIKEQFIVVDDSINPTADVAPPLIISLETRRVLCRCADSVVAATVCATLNDLLYTRPAAIAMLEGKV